MKAITLWPEWAYAIQKLGKDGENRSWRLPKSLVGEWIAIHAGVRGVHAAVTSPRWDELRAFHDTLRVIGVSGCASNAEDIRGHIVQLARFGNPTQNSGSKWAAGDGQWFWPIVERAEIGPVKCKGAQGLWDVPEDVMQDIRARLSGA